MADFTSSSSSPPQSLSYIPPVPSSSSPAAFDDSSDDACSICLEPFGNHDPATITNCKHEYHLQCILEWSQRSNECPICSQLLSLKDPASQEILNAMKVEKPLLRSRNVSAFTNAHSPLERLNEDYDDSCSDDSDFDEHLMQQLAAAESRARYVHRWGRQRSSEAGPSEVLLYNPSLHVSGVQSPLPTSPTYGGNSPTYGGSSPTYGGISPTYGIPSDSDVPYKPRVLYSQPLPESARKLNPSEMFSFPESIKSKISAASARYKESISKSTRGLKEKLIARNASVKELSKGVQREVNAGISGVARMIERLDLTSRRSSTGGATASPFKGKSVQENVIGKSPSEEGEALVRDVSLDSPSLVSSMVADRVEMPSRVQREHDAVRT